ncbi:uncharacterized protein EV420DRAFT_1687541 [Desarmillaria tabescens]|uniref:HNH nuclease domain-containing protein n=1 Tax=Armillaria tabescens TaxID=1929756 RepID=A0AA39KD51_ARMTA|nr:uncharacterized protein EV420DRAFT_1687541 [Desarmillaria tabescens]KAK0457770.1 hypothetical protein EV420DRAFT_1687541 [Desarmillaria tabescens]
MSKIINLHLSTDGAPVQALAVPAEDMRRLLYHPLKWLRYVSFAIFGAAGQLSLMANGPVIDNENTPLEKLVTDYYYVPNCELHLVDPHALNDRVSSSHQTERNHYPSVACQAAHLIPGSKDHEYIRAVYEQRIHLYPFSEMEITDKGSIDCAQNGIFLNAALHLFLGDGSMVLLRVRQVCDMSLNFFRSIRIQTPNFALQPEDVPRVETGPMLPTRLTLQYLKSMDEYPVPPQKDARVTNSHIPPPSPFILDYIYGAAVYRRWAKNSSDIETMMQARSKQFYSLSRPPPSPHSSDNDMPDDDPNDPDYEPGQGTMASRSNKRQKHDHTSHEMLDAMDAIFVLSKLVRGSTPPEIAEEREQRMKEAELREQEANRVNVNQWLHGRPIQ